MKWLNEGMQWALVLLLAGLFLLLKNLDVFGQWGTVAWGGLFAAIGIGFLVWFVLRRQQWWHALPGFILLSVGALILLDWRGITLGDWRGALMLFGIALGFWAVLLVHADNWWALIPAGLLTLLGLLVGLQARLGPAGSVGWLTVLFVGLGVVFGLLYLLRLRQRDVRWAGIPAVALVLVGITTLTEKVAGPAAPIIRLWPVLPLAAGLAWLISALPRRTPTTQPAPTPAYDDAPPPAQGTSMIQTLPEAPTLAPRNPAPAAEDKPVDIYQFLAQQPPETPQAPAGGSDTEVKNDGNA